MSAPPVRADLDAARAQIERIDRAIVALLAERLEVARRAGMLKRELGVPVLDPGREAAVVRRAAELAQEAGLPPEPVRDVFWQIIGLCRREES